MSKPTIILATSNGVGMGHLARASAVALALKPVANPIIVSMAGGIAEIPSFMGIRCEYIPGRDRLWMSREKWDAYLRDRLLALVDETDAKVLSFDGVVPYPGVIAARNANPKLKLVWVRRGLWQKKPQRFILGLQAKMMDAIVEPGDIARAYDFGPTSKRNDSVLTSPVSLFRKEDALSREDARKALGLDQKRPVALVQLGTGDSDVNHKMTAALEGLLGWKDLQVVLTKEPVDSNGNNLAPSGLDIKVIRYFPLANALNAFDAAICAAGYNSVHEELAAKIPTLFVPNIRGTDNQSARAKWAFDNNMALTVDQNNLNEIENSARKLQDQSLRNKLSANCNNLPTTSGGFEVAEIFKKLLTIPAKTGISLPLTLIGLRIREVFSRGFRGFAYSTLQLITIFYRWVKPHNNGKVANSNKIEIYQSEESEELRKLIKSGNPFEHLVIGASPAYKDRRIKIATKAYLK